MARPAFITNEDVVRWSKEIENDTNLPKDLIKLPIIREICFAGLWLNEELTKLYCPNSLVERIQSAAASASFGKHNFWDIHQEFLKNYKENKLDFATDKNNLN